MPNIPDLPDFVTRLLQTLIDAGFEAYAVGGCVRDALLGRQPQDWDLASSALPEDVTALFPHCIPTGIQYGTVTVVTPQGQAQITTFRRDGAYLNARRPDSVVFVSGLADDLSRRDFTVNAMAMDVRRRVTDPFGGREDLRRRLIRCVGEPETRFSQDALRMLRAIRFSAQLGFDVDPAALAAIGRLSHLASRLSAQRVREELVKTLLSPRPELVGLMIEYGLLAKFISENGKNIPWQRLADTPAGLRPAVFALLAENNSSVPSADALLAALGFPGRLVKIAAQAGPILDTLSPEGASIPLALSVCPPDAVLIASAAGGFYPAAAAALGRRSFTRVSDLAITGAELEKAGLTGRGIGETLRRLALSVTAGEVENTPAALLSHALRDKT